MLSKLEEIIQANLGYIIKGGFWLTLGNVISFLSSLVLGIAFANLLPKEIYGQYNFVISTVNLLALFSLTGMNIAITRAVAKERYGSITKVISTRIRWGILGSVISLALAVYYFLITDLNMAFAFFLAAFFIPVLDSLGIYDPILQGRRMFRKATIYLTVNQIVVSILLLTAIIIRRNYLVIAGFYFLANTILNFIFLRKTLAEIPPDQKDDPTTISFGKHMSLQGILLSVVANLDITLVFFFLGPVNAAIYAIALMPAEQIKAAFKNISNLSTPLFAQRKLVDIKVSLSRQSLVIFLFAAAALTGYVMFSPILFKLFFPAYQQSIFYSQLLAISFLTFPVLLPISVMQAHGMTKNLYKYNFFSPIAQISLFLILIPAFGLIGAVTAKIVGRFISLILGFYLLARTGPQRRYN